MMEQRLAALARLRTGESGLTPRQWNLVAWGLCDDDGRNPVAIEDPTMFDPLMVWTQGWITTRSVPRKPWFGLLNSYFTYSPERAAGHGNWLRLRERLADTMPLLIGSQKRQKLWTRMLERHRDLLTDDAGRSLRQVLFNGDATELSELNKGLAVTDASWIWQRAIAYQIAWLNGLEDTAFVAAIPAMLTFLAGHPRFADEMLAALLTRYCQSSQRDESHEQLKNESFRRWGNPQLVGSVRWAMVEAPVRAMVLRWFAKEDLEHFFSLLQGEGQVDKQRLVYWLRFVDQISYTRILLGADALNDSRAEFRNFRAKNAGRYGRLTGGPKHNNAFIMRINNQLFVEFSGTGNACYAYSDKHVPFNPQATYLDTNLELKEVQPDPYGREKDNRIRHLSGWQWRADQFLADRGIRPGATAADGTAPVSAYQPRFGRSDATSRPEATATVAAPVRAPGNSGMEGWRRPAIQQALELARINGIGTENNLADGGYLWLLVLDPAPALKQAMLKLGLEWRPGKGYCIH
ncbi:EH signature protein [Herbaspirillum sp. SJZ107]|nr:EH signature protein [Herbaspirillum sp. SJZ107]